MPRIAKGLSEREEAFCQHYLVSLNYGKAAIAAGYSPNGARECGYRLMQKPAIQARLEKLNEKRLTRVGVDADYVLRRLVDIDEMDAADILDSTGNILPVSQWPDCWRKTISGLEIAEILSGDTPSVLKKIKWPDKLKNLELMGRHVTVGAFKETIDHNHKGEIRTVTRTIVDPKAG